jgi:hypothetical protein
MGRLWKYLAGRLAAPRAGLAPAFVVVIAFVAGVIAQRI